MSNKHIAIVFHGLSYGLSDKGAWTSNERAWESVQENLMRLNPLYTFDIYFHTWDHPQVPKLIQRFQPFLKAYTVEQRPKDNTFFANGSELIQSVKVNDIHADESKCYSPLQKLYSIFSRYYSLQKAVYVIQDIQQYEFIFVLRFDLLLKTKIDLSTMHFEDFYTLSWAKPESIHPNSMVVLDGTQIQLSNLKKVIQYGVCDYIFGMTPTMTLKYATMFQHLPSYLISKEYNDIIDVEGVQGWPIRISGHPIAFWHLKKNNITNIRFLGVCDQDFMLERDDDEAFNNGKTFNEQGKYVEAIEALLTSQYLFKNFNVHLELCYAYTKLGNVIKAIEEAINSASVHPNISAYSNLVVLYRFIKDEDTAKQCEKKLNEMKLQNQFIQSG